MLGKMPRVLKDLNQASFGQRRVFLLRKGRSGSTNGASKFINYRYKVPYLEVQIQPRQFSNLNIAPVRVFNENVKWMHQRVKCMNVSVVGSGRRRRRQSPGSSSLHFFPSLPASWKSAGGSPSESEQAQPRLPREDTRALSVKINVPNCRLHWNTLGR